MKKFITAGSSLLVLSLFLFAGVAFADHSWGGYHWAKTSNPFTLKIGDNVSTVWDSTLATASSDWSQSVLLDTVVVKGASKGNCQPTKGRVEVCNKTYGNNGWLGIAQIWARNSHITQGVVKLNDTYFNTPTYNTAAWRNLVTCQEVGHTLGLDHQDEIFDNLNLGTCMDYTNSPSTNQHPNQHDYDELAIIYGHFDSATTIFSPTGGNNGNLGTKSQNTDLNDPSAWGKKVKQDARGRNSLYERDFGNGEKLFTFVIWAE